MKLALVAASLVLVVGGAAACTGDDNGGEDAPSADEFCGALKEFQDRFADVDPSKDLEGYIRNLKEQADRLEDVGTPSNIPDDAREGFEITVDRIHDLPDDATEDDLGSLGDVSEADQKKLDALESYIEETCPELSDQTEGESP